MQLNHLLDDGTTSLSDVWVSMLGDKVSTSSVTVDVSTVCTTVPVECDTVGCSVLAIAIYVE